MLGRETVNRSVTFPKKVLELVDKASSDLFGGNRSALICHALIEYLVKLGYVKVEKQQKLFEEDVSVTE